jgi:hypothetical protein
MSVNRESILDILADLRPELARRGVASLELFGSAARGEAGGHSDIDLLVEFASPVGLFDFFRLQHWLEEVLGVEKVDLIEKEALHPALREGILKEAVRVA